MLTNLYNIWQTLYTELICNITIYLFVEKLEKLTIKDALPLNAARRHAIAKLKSF